MLTYPFLQAAGSVAAAGTAVWSAGAAVASGGAGIYTLTLDDDADAEECAVVATLRGATSGVLRVVHTSDTVKTVNTFAVDGTTASARDFDFMVIRAPGGT
jgi:hypothetical protein